MEAATIVGVWLGTFLYGALFALGTVEAALGRVIVNPTRINWSVREARLLGLARANFGVIGAVYGLAVVLIYVVAQRFPPFWVGGLVFAIALGVLTFQGLMEQHHKHLWPFSGDRVTGV